MNESSATLPAITGQSLRITEIFCSLQGESSTVGWPTVFVRLTGCPLRCGYCDTAYAFTGGEKQSLKSIVDQVAAFGVRHVTVTGGEPLAQRPCLDLLTALCDRGYQVSLETSGALDVCQVDPRVVKVMDIKTPGSGEAARNLLTNIACLQPQDEVKFVLTGRDDYDWACRFVQDHGLGQRCQVLFSPVHGALAARALADWIVTDRLPVRFQIQLHKHLWGDERAR